MTIFNVPSKLQSRWSVVNQTKEKKIKVDKAMLQKCATNEARITSKLQFYVLIKYRFFIPCRHWYAMTGVN